MTVAVQVRPGDIGLDYAYPSGITAADLSGVTWVCRYLAKLPNPKVIQGPEVARLHALGVAVLLNWEQSAGDPIKGHTVGREHGRMAKAEAENLGYPQRLPIIASVDVGLSFVTKPLALQYLTGFAEMIDPYPLGVYGGTPIINAAVAQLGAVLGWRANASSWSPLSESTANVHIRQRSQDPSHRFDPNTAVKVFDAWLPGPDPKPPQPRPPIDVVPHAPPATTTGIEDLMITARMVRFRPYANVWLIGAGPATQLTGELVESYKADGVPMVELDEHPQALECYLQQSGLLRDDLVAAGS